MKKVALVSEVWACSSLPGALLWGGAHGWGDEVLGGLCGPAVALGLLANLCSGLWLLSFFWFSIGWDSTASMGWRWAFLSPSVGDELVKEFPLQRGLVKKNQGSDYL